MRCPLCGLDNNPSVGVCARCGAPLTATPGPSSAAPSPAPFAAPSPAPSAAPFAAPSPAPFAAPPGPGGGPGAKILLISLALGTVALLSLSAVVVIVLRGRADQPATVATATTPATGTTSPAATAPAGTARDQAAKIDALLDRSVASREKLNGAIARVRRCTGVAGALKDMRTVGDERTKQIADTEATDVSALDHGEAVRSTLRAALGFALAADAHFVSWAEPAATGDCADTPARDAAWERAQASSKQAQAAKKQFIAVWNPLAGPLGFEERSTDHI